MSKPIQLYRQTEDILIQWCEDNLPPIEPLEAYNPPFETMQQHRKDGLCYVFRDGAQTHNTIFNSRKAIHAYRAWHDTIHCNYNLDFNYDGEMMVARLQKELAEEMGIERYDSKLLSLDSMLHIEHYYQWKKHPEYQSQMIRDRLARGLGYVLAKDYSINPDTSL